MNYAYQYYHSCIYISDAHRIMYYFCGHANDLNASCIETAGSAISCFFSIDGDVTELLCIYLTKCLTMLIYTLTLQNLIFYTSFPRLNMILHWRHLCYSEMKEMKWT